MDEDTKHAGRYASAGQSDSPVSGAEGTDNPRMEVRTLPYLPEYIDFDTYWEEVGKWMNRDPLSFKRNLKMAFYGSKKPLGE